MLKKYLLLLVLLGYNVVINAQNAYYKLDTTDMPMVNLNQIVVAASREEMKLKELPTSVSIMQNRAIENNEVNNLSDISAITPNLIMPDYGSKLTSPIYIRGIGSRINSPSIGLYVDNVPYFDKGAFDFDFFDLKRIEVLRGPQGTLYGRNSMGGLINIITLSPMDYQGFRARISGGNYGNLNAKAGYYGKFSDNFAASLSLNYRHSDGYFDNDYLSEKVDDLNSYSLNNKLIYKLSDKLTFENIFSMELSKQGGYPYAIYNDSLQIVEKISYNQRSFYNRNMFNDALKVKYSDKNWEISNAFSYQAFDSEQKIDQDLTPQSLYFAEQTRVQNMISDELIVKSKGEKRYQWLFGGFAFLQNYDSGVRVNLYQKDMWYLKTNKPVIKGIAFFHQSRYNLTDKLTATLGLRQDYESSKLHYLFEGEAVGQQMPRQDTVYPELRDNVLLPKFALTYNFDNVSIYASYTTGYKPGGFNITFESPEQLTFKHEKSRNYELGVKSSFFNHFLYADFTLFYTDLENQQIYRTVTSGRGAYLDNAGVSRNKGFELSFRNRLTKGFEAIIAYGFTDSKIIEYVKNEKINYNDNFTPYIPRHTFSVQLNKTFDFGDFVLFDKLRLNVLYNFFGKKYWTLDNNYFQDEYGLLNGKISFYKGDFKIDIWGKNLIGVNYNSFLFQALGNTYVQEGKPLQFGVNISMEL